MRRAALATLLALIAAPSIADPCRLSAPAMGREVYEGILLDLTAAEAAALHDCLKPALAAAMAGPLGDIAGRYQDWRRFSAHPFLSPANGPSYASIYVNAVGAASYAGYEGGGPVPAGTVIAKDGFKVGSRDGIALPVGLFVMEKLAPGSRPATGDWRFARIEPGGKLVSSDGPGDSDAALCADCHSTLKRARDWMLFPPAAARLAAAAPTQP